MTSSLRSLLGLLFCALFIACGGGGETPDGGVSTDTGTTDSGGGTDTGTTDLRPPDAVGSEVHEFVSRLFVIGREGSDGTTPGFNLDRHNTTGRADRIGCGHEDFLAPARFGGHNGVDNQLGLLLDMVAATSDFDADAEIEESIAEADLMVLVQLREVGDLVNDGRVDVWIYLGVEPAGGLGIETVTTEGASRRVIAGGQTFGVDPISLDAGGTDPLLKFDNSYIRDGRLYAGPGSLFLTFPTSSGPLDLEIRQARLEFDVSPTALTNAMLGGHVRVDDVISAIQGLMIEDFPLTDADLRTLLASYTDIDDGLYDPDNFRSACDSVSLGIVFEGASATIAR